MLRKFKTTICVVITAAASWTEPSAIAKKPTAHNVLSEKQAMALVVQRPEVKEWKKAVLAASKSRGVSAHVELDRTEKGEYVIHAYEYVPDDAKTGHTATFNWYHVNQRSRKVTKEF